ncbi:MAG: hypothetical protein PUK66_03160 [Bacteroidales bacterium]|uniref:hypothetical protein n=1 Tax=Porphyromonas sp. TaxID=1924944 RepID=UPI0029715975|nr:hypothetical protein [Porphyromonas sp.]MDD7437821.1 hypothetical protein [Bacteroidales bacterium]MDY3067176.1 hypothetical protein [Porphyromonas sp.]
MAPSAGFWEGFKKVLLLLIIIGVVAAVLLFIFMPGNKGMFFGGATLILVLNLALMLIFTRTNDKKRPGTREKGEPKRFDFHRDR